MGVKTRKLGNINDQLVQWQAVVVADGSTGLTAVSGRGYFINTTSGAITVTLPSSPNIGDNISIIDYAGTFGSNNVTINVNGKKLNGVAGNGTLSTSNQQHTIVFTDDTKGWKIFNQDTASSLTASYVTATGGTVATSGDHKIHTFTGDGNFVVSDAGNSSGSNTVDYLVIAGGGAGHYDNGGGGGAGGFRYSNSTFPVSGAPGAPLAVACGLPVSAQTYPVTVGGGGAGQLFANSPVVVNNGSNSVFSTITSTGGGGGPSCGPNNPAPVRNAGFPGGSGGGAGQWSNPDNPGTGGSGNTPPVSPSQGNPGGDTGPSRPNKGGAGGGGAMAAGTPAPSGNDGGAGGDGAGLPDAFGTNGVPCGSYRYFAGGGGGGGAQPGTGGSSTAGKGGATASGGTSASSDATANTGSGAGGGSQAANGASGGKGIVVIRYKFQN